MKYSIISSVNGNYKVEAEYGENLQGAIVGFHNKCAAYWNAADVINATVAIVDEGLDVVQNKKEFISHEQPEPEPNEG